MNNNQRFPFVSLCLCGNFFRFIRVREYIFHKEFKSHMAKIQTGLERLIVEPKRWISKDRIGLLCNPASVNRRFTHARMVIDQTYPQQLKALYSPQHGFFAEKQDNMVESEDIIDPALNIPVFSLYGRIRIPGKKMFDPIDILIVDLQDVGTRLYTFIYTMSYCLEAAKSFGKKVLVLDRPNPVNGAIIEGNCLSPEYASFVGRIPSPCVTASPSVSFLFCSIMSTASVPILKLSP